MEQDRQQPDADDQSPSDSFAAIDAELAFHIESLLAQIERDGCAPDDAAAEVRRRFGDVGQYRNACRRIAMKEQIMKQRLQYIVMGLMLAIIVGLAISTLVVRRQALEQRLAAEVERERAEMMSAYLMNVMSAQNAMSDAREVSIREVLDEASIRVSEWNLQGHPEIEARLREAIEAAKLAINEHESSDAVDESRSQEDDDDDDESSPESSQSILIADS